METTDGRDKDILDKGGVETNGKDREETLKDAPTSSNNIEGSQETLFLREEIVVILIVGYTYPIRLTFQEFLMVL